jgi:hypothetical protein
VVPFRGRLELPGGYSIRVTASQLDPTNPHDHANLFEHRGADGGAARVTMSIPNAVDRFCFPAGGGCSATVRAARGSQLAGLLGGRSAPVTAGFDHEKLARVDLLLRRGR